jgi:hypothetical protein
MLDRAKQASRRLKELRDSANPDSKSTSAQLTNMYMEHDKEAVPLYHYAIPLTDSDDDTREEFFTNMNVLIERQTSPIVRFEVLSLLYELAAIEVNHRSSDPATRGGRAHNHTTVDNDNLYYLYEFGMRALTAVRDLMRASIVGLHDPLIESIQKVLLDIFQSMSQRYVIAILPILTQMVQDPRHGRDVTCELFYGAEKLVDVYDLSWHLMRPGVTVTDSKDAGRGSFVVFSPAVPTHKNSFFHQDRTIRLPEAPWTAFCNVCSLLSLSCSYEPTATLLHEDEKVTYQLIVQKTIVENREVLWKFSAINAIHSMMASLAKYNRNAANALAQPHENNPSDKFVVNGLLDHFRKIEENMRQRSRMKRSEQNLESGAIYDALILRCINGILSNSATARDFLRQREKPAMYVTTLTRVAKNGDNGTLVAAGLEGLLVIIESGDSMEKWRNTLLKEIDIAKNLQEITKNLWLRNRKWNYEDREAIKYALDMMRIISERATAGKSSGESREAYKQVSRQLNDADVEGFDRESILFRLLASTLGTVTDDVKLAAAKCLREVPLHEFDKTEIRNVVNMLASIPEMVSSTVYEMIANALYLLFTMAMDESESDAKVIDKGCGLTFRNIYATEVTSAVFGAIERGVTGDLADYRTTVPTEKRVFELACVKFLMTAWGQDKLREGIDSDANKRTLYKVLSHEHKYLNHLYRTNERQKFQDHKHMCLEQTYIGYDVNNLLESLRFLESRDIVSFRVLHQLANDLEDNIDGNQTVLTNLVEVANVNTFEGWIGDAECGRDIVHLAREEQKEWHTVVTGNAPSARWEVVEAEEQDAHDFADIQREHNKFFIELKDPSVPEDPTGTVESDADVVFHRERKAKTWKATLARVAKEPNAQHLVLLDKKELEKYHDSKNDISNKRRRRRARDAKFSDPTRPIVAFCGGGPSLVPGYDDPSTCQLYGIYVRHEYAAMRNELCNVMLRRFSHDMFSRGYTRCVAYAHEKEKSVFAMDCSPLDMESDPVDPRKEICYMWSLSKNVWTRVAKHRTFLDSNGVHKVLQFLHKEELETLNTYNPNRLQLELKSTIRNEIEDFGTELQTTLLDRQGKGGVQNAANLRMDMGPTKTLDEELYDIFRSIADCAEAKLASNEKSHPTWDFQLMGTSEENFLQTLTLTTDGVSGMSVYTESNAVRQVQDEMKKVTLRQNEMQFPKWSYAGPQMNANVSAMLRIYFALVKGVLTEVALEDVRSPVVFNGIRTIVTRVNFGLRDTITDEHEDTYKIALKTVQLVEAVMYMYPQSLDESLEAIELFEVLSLLLLELMEALARIINSRSSTSDDPLYKLRQLNPYEERVAMETFRVYNALLHHVMMLQFFDKMLFVEQLYHGNSMCRQKALQVLYGDAERIDRNIQDFLLYDSELSRGTDFGGQMGYANGRPEDEEAAAAAAEKNAQYRDVLRLHLYDIVACISAFSDEYRYTFIRNFVQGSSQAELCLKKSALAIILRRKELYRFRWVLEEACAQTNVFIRLRSQRSGDRTDDNDENADANHSLEDNAEDNMDVEADASEVVIAVHFLCRNVVNANEKTMLVLTNRAYYLSAQPIAYGEHTQLPTTVAEVLTTTAFVDMVRYRYQDIKHLFLETNEQMFALTRASTRRRNEQKTDRFLSFERGVCRRVIQTLSRFRKNDFGQPMVFHMDHFLPMSLALNLNMDTAQMAPRAYSVVRMFRDNEELHRLLFWIGDAAGTLVSCKFKLMAWVPGTTPRKAEAKNVLSVNQKLEVGDMTTVEFTRNERSMMVMEFAKKRLILNIWFADDVTREVWRRQLRALLSQSMDWADAFVPDLADKPHRKVL